MQHESAVDSEWLGFSEERLVRLVLQGLRGPMTVNGEVVNEGTSASVTKGKILLQSEGAEIFFRKVELRPLKK